MAGQGYTVNFQSVLKAIDAGRLDIVEKLRLAGFNLAAPDAQGRTALGHAAFIGNSKILTHLFQLGVPCDIRDPEGFLPLHWACLGKNNDACCLLLIKHATPAHINAVNKMKQTPLHCAAHSGRKWLISLLLDKGGQPHINDFDSRKQSALDVAIARKHEGAIELLKARGGFTFKFLNTP
jgi:ankyrin repeat protein